MLLMSGINVGTLENGYVREVPLPRVPRSKSTSLVVVAATVLANPLDAGYLPDPRILLYNNLIQLLLGIGMQCVPVHVVG
jgi:hypothetical protein